MNKRVNSILSALIVAGACQMAAHAAVPKDTYARTNAMGLSVNIPLKDVEKCYGIARKGLNNCANAQHGCYGYAIKDAMPDEYVFVPKGSCLRIKGGSLTLITGKPSAKNDAFMKKVTNANGELNPKKLDAMRVEIPASKIELCYGIAKKGMNDCANAIHSCAHQATRDGSKDEYVHTIRGTCKQIVGSVKSELPDING